MADTCESFTCGRVFRCLFGWVACQRVCFKVCEFGLVVIQMVILLGCAQLC